MGTVGKTPVPRRRCSHFYTTPFLYEMCADGEAGSTKTGIWTDTGAPRGRGS